MNIDAIANGISNIVRENSKYRHMNWEHSLDPILVLEDMPEMVDGHFTIECDPSIRNDMSLSY